MRSFIVLLVLAAGGLLHGLFTISSALYALSNGSWPELGPMQAWGLLDLFIGWALALILIGRLSKAPASAGKRGW